MTTKGAPLWAWVVLCIVGLLFIIGGVVLGEDQNRREVVLSYPLCTGAEDQRITTTTTIRVRPDCWSGWLKLKPGTEVEFVSSQAAEMFSRDGRRIAVPTPNVGFLGNHLPDAFRLRGSGGTVIVKIHDW